MRRFFLFLFCFALVLSLLLSWQTRQSQDRHILQKETPARQSLTQSESWRDFVPPEVIAVSPADTTMDVVVGIEDPLVVRFSSSVNRFFLDFTLEP